jgi:hypothetical protein
MENATPLFLANERLRREKQQVSTVVTEFTLSVGEGSPAWGAISRGRSSFGFDCVIARPDPAPPARIKIRHQSHLLCIFI